MSYRAGTRGLGHLGLPDGNPRLICDGCGVVRPVTSSTGKPYAWLLDRKKAPGWTMESADDGCTRRDYCRECSAKREEG